MSKYEYFISFSAIYRDHPIFGNIVVDLYGIISTEKDLRLLHDALNDHPQLASYSNVVVLYFVRLRGD